jgi:hypothetical protein
VSQGGSGPSLREPVIPFGRSGHVALIKSEDSSSVLIVVVRRHLEDDYH